MATLAEQYMDFYAQQELEKNAAPSLEAVMAKGDLGHKASMTALKGAIKGRSAVEGVGEKAMNAAGSMGPHTRGTAQGVGAGTIAAGGAALGGAALLARKLMKKSPGEKLVGALKKNRGAIAAGGAGAAGLGALAAFRKKDK